MSSPARFIRREQLAANLTALRRWEPAALAGATAARGEALASAIRAEAHAAGFDEGRRAGLESGRAAALLAVQRLAKAAAAAEHAAEGLLAEVADSVVDLAFTLARQVVVRELASQPHGVLAVVRAALSELPPGSIRVEVLMHPEDAAAARDARTGDPMPPEFRIGEDPTITRGGCRLVTSGGQIDATLETRWKSLASALGRSLNDET